MTFAEVPMPHRIAQLPRDKRGFPVPYVSEWSSQGDGPKGETRTMELPGFTWYGPIIVPTDVVGEGVARLGKVEPAREMQCHEHRLCNVCGQQIGSKLIFVGGWSDGDVQTYSEAPLHRECARYALRVCPGLLDARWTPGKRLAVTIVQDEARRYRGRFVDSLSKAVYELTDDEARLYIARGTLLGLLSLRVFIDVRNAARVDSEEWLR